MNFADTTYGTVMRSSPPKRTRTASDAQIAQQARIAAASRGWADLTAGQVLEWDAYAATQTHVGKSGVAFTPNGYQAYSALAAVWYAANGLVDPAPSTPPSTPYEGERMTIAATASAGSIAFAATGPAPSPDTLVELSLQRLANANRKPSANGFRVRAIVPLSPGASIQFGVSPGAYAAQYAFIDKATGARTKRVTIAVSGVALALEKGGADEAARPAARKKAA